ncbi:MAG: restriction endonuclease [Anaerolineae bacterium]|nr:restriction endonuclease [Anaerolineae bacterium]
MRKSDLPFGSEFSPTTISFSEALEIVKEHKGSKEAIEGAFRDTYFAEHATTERNKRKLAMNLRLSMQNYLLMGEDFRLTEFGNHLYEIRDNEAQLYRELARHILLNLMGLTLVQCVQDMQFAGEKVTLVSIRRNLEERGVHFPRGGKHASMIRLWLSKAGVIKGAGWRVDQKKLESIIGVGLDEIEALMQLTPEQQAFLKTLANIGDGRTYASNDIERLATATYGVRFNEKMMARTVVYPLRDAGYIKVERGTDGRGAKAHLITPTEKLVREVTVPLIEQFERQMHADLRPLLRKPVDEILAELKDEDTHVKGLALEALAFKLMRLIDLRYVGTRLRGSATGGAEVDVVFDSTRLVFTRWQVQCKNRARVALDDVAKEVGLTQFLKSNAIVIVGTGKIGSEARYYASRIMQDTNLAIIMIDGEDLESIAANPPYIVSVLHREAKQAMRLKEIKLEGE